MPIKYKNNTKLGNKTKKEKKILEQEFADASDRAPRGKVNGRDMDGKGMIEGVGGSKTES